MIGLSLASNGAGRVFVLRVATTSIAELAGITPGMVVLRVNEMVVGCKLLQIYLAQCQIYIFSERHVQHCERSSPSCASLRSYLLGGMTLIP